MSQSIRHFQLYFAHTSLLQALFCVLFRDYSLILELSVKDNSNKD